MVVFSKFLDVIGEQEEKKNDIKNDDNKVKIKNNDKKNQIVKKPKKIVNSV